jgi:hypothetical protein
VVSLAEIKKVAGSKHGGEKSMTNPMLGKNKWQMALRQ